MSEIDLIYQEVEKLFEQSQPPVFAVFDFDNTCIINDITEANLAYMARNNLFRDKNLLGSKFEYTDSNTYAKAVFTHYYELLAKNNIKEAYEFISTILSNFNVSEVSPLVSKVINFEGESITKGNLFGREIAKGLKPRKQVFELIDFLKNHGIAVWIVTASIEALVKEAMKHFNLDANIMGVRNVIANDIFTPQLEKPLPMFEGKVECIKKFVHQKEKPLLGVGDSINDLPMLEYSQIKVVVDRNNALTAKAKENSWFLLSAKR